MTFSLLNREPLRLYTHLLPSLALALVCTVLFWWRPFGQPPMHATFHALLAGDEPGTAVFHYDVDGAGLKGGATEPVKVPGGRAPTPVQFPMKAGRLNAIHLIPRVEAGKTYLLRCWITGEAGQTIAELSPALIGKANPRSAGMLPNGLLLFQPQPQVENGGLLFRPEPAIELAVAPPPPRWQTALVFITSLLVSLGLSLAFGERAAAGQWFTRVQAWGLAHPVWALLLAAEFSVSLACFPVIFCGKSFVSPDNGLLVLYDRNPTVPGAAGGRVDNGVGADLGETIYWGIPATKIQQQALLHDHEFPLWNRYNWSGLTLLGQGISAIGDPLNWPAILTGGAAWLWDWKFIIAQVLLAFGVGLTVWRTCGSLATALLLALSAPFIGFFAYRYDHPAFFSICYAPWILLPWIEGSRAQTLRSAVSWAFLLMLADWWQLNSGTAKEMSALLLFTNLAGGLMILLAAQPLKWRASRLGIFAGANVLFFLLSAPLWMTFLDALGKAHTSYDQPRIYQLTPGLALGLFDDIFHRQFMPGEFLFNPSANFFVLLGVAWALVRVRALAGERMLWAVAVPAVIAAALAFGVISPEIAATIPFLKNIYHFDNTFSCVLFILMFVIAGYGLRECLTRMRDPEWLGDWALMLTFVGVLVASYFGLADAAHRVGRTFLKVGETIPKSPFFTGYVPALLAALALFPWAWRQACLRRPAAAAWGAVMLCAFVTMHFRHGMYLETKFDFYTRNPKTRLDLRHLTSPALEAIRTASSEPGRVIGLDWEVVPGFTTMLGFETISGPDALMNPAMLQLTSTLGIQRIWDWRIQVKTEDFASVHRALDMLNVRYLLAAPNSGDPALPGMKVLSVSDMIARENPTAWPRAFFTDTVGVCDSGAELRRLVEEGDGRPFAIESSATRAHLPLPARDLAKRVVAPARNYRLTTNATTFEIDAPSEGVAVLLEANVPGDIIASVDGEPATCLPINHAFRGVLIPQAGHHVVKFEYWPAVLDTALNLAIAGLVGLVLVFWWWWRAGKTLAQAAGPVPSETVADRK